MSRDEGAGLLMWPQSLFAFRIGQSHNGRSIYQMDCDQRNEDVFNRQSQCFFEVGQDVGWDQRCFAAPAHQISRRFPMVGRRLKRAGPTLR